MTTTIHIGPPNAFGCFSVKTTTDGKHSRRVVSPGRLEGGTFVPTDLSAEPVEVVAAANLAWTPEVVAAWEAKLRADVAATTPALDPEGNGRSLAQRQRSAKKDEIQALIEQEDLAAALRLAVELIP